MMGDVSSETASGRERAETRARIRANRRPLPRTLVGTMLDATRTMPEPT